MDVIKMTEDWKSSLGTKWLYDLLVKPISSGGIDIDNVTVKNIHFIKKDDDTNIAHIECYKDRFNFAIVLVNVNQAIFAGMDKCDNVIISIENTTDCLVLLVRKDNEVLLNIFFDNGEFLNEEIVPYIRFE